MIGADVAQMRDLAKTMTLSGRQLDNVSKSLHTAVSQTGWHGPDSDKFRQQWATRLRPVLRSAGASIEEASKLLSAQADEQETASADTGGGAPNGQPDSPSADKDWSDVFTDPNYQHAPGGIQFMMDKFFGADGAATAGMVNALKFAADKFGWNLSLADLKTQMPKLFTAMKWAGRALGVVGVFLGGLDIWSGIENKDPFRVADGSISAALSIAAIAATATGVGAPVGIAIGAVGLVWGIASMISGDVPLTKRIWDGGAAVVGGIKDAANAVGDGLGWLGGKLGLG